MRPDAPQKGLTPVLLLLTVLALSGAPAMAAESKAPIMAQGLATITEVNYFANFNTSGYSLTIGTMEVRADKQGQPCEGFATGQTADARYDSKTLMLERDKQSCKLRIRRMEFTDPPGSAPPAAR